MAGRPSLMRPVSLHITLPEDLHARLTLHLYSESEHRVPKGGYRQFMIDRITEYFARKDDPNVNS